MTCEVSVNDVFIVTIGGKKDHLVVVGTAVNCDQVNLTLACSGKKTAIAKVSGGAWAAQVPWAETGCECGSTITVSAECASGGCRFGPAKFTLLCQEQSNCPLVSAKAPQISDCNKDGTRTVAFFYQVFPQGTPVGAMLFVDGKQEGQVPPQSPTYVLTYTTTLPPGSHTVSYLFDPKACGGASLSFDVDPCPLPGGCPKIEFEDAVFESDCRDGSRSVRVTATIEPQGSPTDAKLLGTGGVILQTATGQTAPFKLSAVQNVPNGSTTFSVIVVAPRDCPGKSQTINVDCVGSTPPPPPNDDDGGGDGWCFFGRVAIVLLFATALFLLLVGLCLVLPWALIAAAVAAVVAALAFALWWAFCGSKCAALLIGWQTLAVGAAVAAFLSGCCLPSLLIAIVLAIAALAGFFGWIQVCRPSACKSLFELLWVFVTPVPLILQPLSKIAPCGLPAVPAWIGIAAAALLLLWGVLCAKKV